MPLTVHCPRCYKNLLVPDGAVGNEGQCPSCEYVFVISETGYPEATQSAAPPPPLPPPLPPLPPVPGEDLPYASPQPFPDVGSHPRPSGAAPAPETFNHLYLALLLLSVGLGLGAVVLGVVYLAAEEARVRRLYYYREYDFSEMEGRRIRYQPPPGRSPAEEFFPILASTYVLVWLAQVIVFLVFLYKCWDLIQDGRPRATPAEAVGYLFVPVFNLYWIFVAIGGLADELNRYARRRRYLARPANTGHITAGLVMQLGVFLPVLGPFICMVGLIILLVGLASIKSTAADIAMAKRAALAAL